MPDKNYEVLPTQRAYKVDTAVAPEVSSAAEAGKTDDSPPMEIRSALLTNDVITTWTRGGSGATVPWNARSPEMYQILINVKGRCRYDFKNDDGEVRSVTADAGDIVYLPPGAESRAEVVSDEEHIHAGVMRRVRVPRLGHLFGDHESLYDPKAFPAALVLDDMNDRVLRKDDRATTSVE